MTTHQEILDFYLQPATMTSGGRHASLLEALPRDADVLAQIVQGLVIHESVASSFYGVAISDARRSEAHLRPVEGMIDRLLALDDAPLSVARPAERRLVGVCHHFVLFLVAMLRAKGIPARARCGFGAYFNPGTFEEHWVCEYWDDADGRWALADPQFDEVWRTKLKIKHDILDLPRDRFLVAGDAWVQGRTGKADPLKFGIFERARRGLWFIAGDLVRDVAALNNMEMLPWDVWGAIPSPDAPLDEEALAFFDQLALLTQAPDASFDELRRLYEEEDGVRVPATVFNALLNRPEEIRVEGRIE
ncbi:MAG: transglutaminase domain-containing protein [Nitrospirae bacterium]|nr:transglutaminase domain-containing protein [Candidatus Manganitrophaceae bacterium]